MLLNPEDRGNLGRRTATKNHRDCIARPALAPQSCIVCGGPATRWATLHTGAAVVLAAGACAEHADGALLALASLDLARREGRA